MNINSIDEKFCTNACCCHIDELWKPYISNRSQNNIFMIHFM